jgi:hypothetical protein
MRGLVALGVSMLLGAAGCDERALPSPDASASASASAASTTGTAKLTKPKTYERVVLSPVYEVDKIYPSMTGPQSTETLRLEDLKEPELLWIVGFEAVMVEPEGDDQISQEFMCHTNLDMDPASHQRLFSEKKITTGRLFTLSQGQYRIDMPEGFGIPVLSTEALNLNTQVLNLNESEGKRKVRHKVIMRYQRDKELTEPMKALYVAGAYGLKLLEGKDGHYGLDGEAATETAASPHDHHGHHGDHGHDEAPSSSEVDHTACLPGENAGQNTFGDGKGRKFTGHWVVKPGREVNHTRVTELMDLPFDTTLHYVAVHLHPFAESLALKDLTSGKVVYQAKTKQAERGVGLAHVDFLSSDEGIPLYADHEYELVSVYENTSGKDQDSMAVMNLYLHDKEFEKPDLSKVKAASETSSGDNEPSKPSTMGM